MNVLTVGSLFLQGKEDILSYVKIKIFVVFVMNSQDSKLVELNQNKTRSITYTDLESLIKRINGCDNDFKKSSTTRVFEHIPREYSMYTIWTFDDIKNSHDVYRRKDFMRRFCTF